MLNERVIQEALSKFDLEVLHASQEPDQDLETILEALEAKESNQ